MRSSTLLILAGLLLISACAGSLQSGKSTSIAITGATIISMDGGGRIEDGVVIMEGDRIAAVGTREETAVPANARRIDATGKFLVPGLVDMHTHLPQEPGVAGDATWRQLRLMVANGVTTARSMSGHASHPQIRDAILSQDLLAPVLYVAAPAMHQGNTPDTATAAAKVQAAKADGFDLIKSHHIEDPEVWRAVQATSQRLEIPTAGHLVSTVSLEEAIRAGQQIEHLDGYFAALLPKDSPARDIAFGQIPPPPVMQAIDRKRIDDVAQRVAELNGWTVPTVAVFESIADTETAIDTLRTQPEMKYAPAAALDQWAARREQLLGMGIMQSIGEEFVAARRDIVRALDSAGAGIMAGSDTPQEVHMSGFGLHTELAALEAAGLSPLAALATATSNPRRYFESLPGKGSASARSADFGIIAPGNRADLLLLNADPSKDIHATRAIDSVILRGRLLDRAALDGLLKSVSDSITAAVEVEGKPGEVLLVRHAAAESHDGDSGLSDAGREQARRFAQQFADFGADIVMATPTRRARETAGIIAASIGARVEEYHPGQLDQLAATLRKDGGKIIVVGHSNTTPTLVRMLGGEAGSAIAADEYDRVYRVSLPSGATTLHQPSAWDARVEPCRLPGIGSGVRCGAITVAEKETGNTRKIDVHFAVLPATGEVKLPPLIIAPGGPGLGGKQSGAGVAQLFESFRTDRDLWLIDQRGTGESNRLDCELPTDLAAAIASLSSKDTASIMECRDRLAQQADLGAYTTPVAVRDMEKIRQVLGAKQVDIFGMSYGTRIATEFARQFPEHVRALVIRSPAPPAMQLPLFTPRDAEQSVQRVIGLCGEEPACAAAFPDIGGDVQKVLRRLDAGPVDVTVVDPRSGQPVETKFTRDAFGSVMFFLLYIPEYYRQMPALVHAAANGNFEPMVQSVAPLIVGTLDQVAWGMRWSVICNEDVARIDHSKVRELSRNTFFGDAPIAAELHACDLWPDATVEKEYFEPPQLEQPVLVISGTVDPVAPPVWGEYLLDTLENAVHLPVTGASHLPVFPGCTKQLTLEFLAQGSLNDLDTQCAEQRQVPAFVVPNAR